MDEEEVAAFDRHTADQLAATRGETPLFHLSLPLSVDLMHAISKGVTRELGRMGWQVLIGEGGRVFARPKPADGETDDDGPDPGSDRDD